MVYSQLMDAVKIREVKELLREPKNIVLVAHKNPDGDAMGSALAMQHYLTKKGHSARTVLPNDVPDFLRWLPGADIVYKYDKQNTQSKKVIDHSEIMFVLDFNAFHRVGEDMQKALEAYLGKFVMIDHHQQPDPISPYIYSDTSICSTCQMVYNFIEMMGDLDLIDANIATCIYTGIMTDTGSFRFPSTTSDTHKIIADLIENGAENSVIHEKVYSTNSPSRLKLLGVAMNNLKIEEDFHTAYITMTQKELNQSEYQKGDTEGFVNYGLSLKGIHLAAIFIEDTEQRIIKISFRSKGTFSVNQFARKYFDGGGHDNAAGGRSNFSMQQTVQKFVDLLPNYKKALEKSYEK